MEVSAQESFKIIYSLFAHEYLGYLFESFAIQLDEQDRLTFKHQNISFKNASEFEAGLDDVDYELIRLMDSIQQDVIVKKFYNKKIRPADFFFKVYNKEKGDKILQETIARYIEDKKSQILELLYGKNVFIMGKDGEPAWKQVEVPEEKATVLFHFMKNEDNTHYFPTIKHRGEKVNFQYNESILVSYNPAWLLAEDKLMTFEKEVDGKKLKPFLNKKFIVIPKSVEEQYYKNFVSQIVSNFNVHAKGFEIRDLNKEAKVVLTFSAMPDTSTLSLFDEKKKDKDENTRLVFELCFEYGNYLLHADSNSRQNVKMEKVGDTYRFIKLSRDRKWEKQQAEYLKNIGLDLKNGKAWMEKPAAISWMKRNEKALEESGISIRQNPKDDQKYFVGNYSIDIEVKETNDWFDINALVKFGEFSIPFLTLKDLILKQKREFKLPNGQIAVIPEEWITNYSELFAFTEEDKNNTSLTLKKHHVALVHELQTGNLANVQMDRKLEKLKNFTEIEDFPLPKALKGTLRPYQQAGYNWMQFLNQYNFGGCLADDMGLGKTVQTLTMLQYQKEQGSKNASLLIMPTSLVYNWEMEANKFVPDLKIFVYTGTGREKNVEQFQGYDIVITSYGIVRLDVDILKEYYFNYVILDESQAIKNPSSNIAKAVKKLKSKNRLILSGTPIENSTLDLWSQISFINPGLLGTEKFFKNEYLNPIEKNQDVDRKKKLYAITKPFIMRRQKSQVLTDLPEKIENVRYIEMSEDQAREYEKVKSNYRNQILEMIDEGNKGKSNMVLLQGLTKLRQIANHPKMADPDYTGESAKLIDVMEMVDSAIDNDHKVLIFSQFVKHLGIVKEELDKLNIDYAYLDGATKARKNQVEMFQNNDEVKVFLISLKAGGLGLNLTAADYVFILDPWWNPAIEAQAVDRAHRIGQENNVFTYKFITKNSVEEKILKLQQAKRQLATELISTEESFIKNLSTEDIEALLQ